MNKSFANMRGGELVVMSSEEVLEKVKGIIVEQLPPIRRYLG